MFKTLTISACIFTSSLALAQAPFSFPDTPKNRALYEQSYKKYKTIDKEHGHFSDVNGIKLHYLEWGDKSGIPLIWSHGYSSTGFELSQVGQSLADLGYHVFAITYRGHGQTQVTNYNFSLSTIADDIAAFMDQKHYSCAVIGGLSLGGSEATTFYENYPERVLAVVLEDGGADSVQERMERAYPKLRDSLAEFPKGAAEAAYSDRFNAFQNVVAPYLGIWKGWLPADAAPIFQSYVAADSAGNWRFHIDSKRLFGEDNIFMDPASGYKLPLLAQSFRRVNPIITYRNLNVPVLIIDPTGDDNGPFGSFSPDYEKLQKLHPNLIRHVKYPQTLHAAHIQRPDWFVRDMKDLIYRVRTLHNDACLLPGKK